MNVIPIGTSKNTIQMINRSQGDGFNAKYLSKSNNPSDLFLKTNKQNVSFGGFLSFISDLFSSPSEENWLKNHYTGQISDLLLELKALKIKVEDSYEPTDENVRLLRRMLNFESGLKPEAARLGIKLTKAEKQFTVENYHKLHYKVEFTKLERLAKRKGIEIDIEKELNEGYTIEDLKNRIDPPENYGSSDSGSEDEVRDAIERYLKQDNETYNRL